MTKKLKVGRWNIFLAIVAAAFFSLGYAITQSGNKTDVVTNIDVSQLKSFPEEDLSKFDGDEPGEMILIGLNGWVYDVSPGSDFYNSNGPYHYLAGRDSSKELNLVGGEIIKSKYKIVGKLIK